jgi:phosphatase NudJ
MAWSLTVAAIIQRGDHFLMVEEQDPGHPQPVLNQPAGHVEPGESILQAVIRETREEAGVTFAPSHLVGIYQLQAKNGQDYCRVCIAGTVPAAETAAPQDPEILACHWLTREEIASRPQRSSVVLACLDDYLGGRNFALDAIAAIRTDR